uniref:Uncharacterized protein n=1 Tax=Plectus sambesii TaxID=2011161 RepID=A0A914XKJ2_9BILA
MFGGGGDGARKEVSRSLLQKATSLNARPLTDRLPFPIGGGVGCCPVCHPSIRRSVRWPTDDDSPQIEYSFARGLIITQHPRLGIRASRYATLPYEPHHYRSPLSSIAAAIVSNASPTPPPLNILRVNRC